VNQVRGFRAHYEEFQALNAEIIEISCDSVAVQKAWVESMGEHEGVEGVPFHVASDFWPHGAVTKAYGVFNEDRGNSRRSVFIIDSDGIIYWSNLYTESIPAAGELLHEIEKLQNR
jgi:alkyl hydroperoxide reductase subunit AhpC|tara:strand:- start:67 stop:414 length:348 start_codon:yes stop_codon:yes gene_type:complete